MSVLELVDKVVTLETVVWVCTAAGGGCTVLDCTDSDGGGGPVATELALAREEKVLAS